MLWDAIHKTASLHFYEETDQDIERVLDIFVRVNSGGTVLSYSDLLLSIATAQWEGDARAAVHGLVDELNHTGNGFSFSRDTVLKAGLVTNDVRDISFKVKNFTAANMAQLEAGWDSLSAALQVAVGLLSDFGLSGGSLTADSVLIPVAYYVHHRKLDHGYRQSPNTREDRMAMRSWLLRSLIIRGIWGSGLDTLLRDVREVIRSEGADSFPVAAIERAMAARGKSLAMTDALVDDVLSLEYGRPRTFAVLAALFHHVDTRNQFHVDHIFPASLLEQKSLRRLAKRDGAPQFTPDEIDELMERKNQLPNLELLPGLENMGKLAEVPAEWVATNYATSDERSSFLERNALPEQLPHGAAEFDAFFRARRELLETRIRTTLRPTGRDYAPQSPSVLALDEELAGGDDID